jgi:hypothetical protein
MKYKLIPLLFVVMLTLTVAYALAQGKRRTTKHQINGKILISHDYCGGARPNEEQLNKQTFAAKGTTLYICRLDLTGARMKYSDSVVCDSVGNFKVKLTKGSYAFVEKWKTEPLVMPSDTQFEIWDTACYRTVYNTADLLLGVTGMKNVNITLHRHCSWNRPCCSYSGPFPPASPPVNRSGNQPGHQE